MMMKCLLLLTLISVVTSLRLQDLDKEWYRFKVKYNRAYSTKEEEMYRYSVFTQTFKNIYFHNKEADLGKYTYRLGVNKFADMTTEEFQRIYANHRMTASDKSTHVKKNQKPYVVNKRTKSLARQIDWRNKDNKTCVTRVKNQGNFNTCYAFAATAVLESHKCVESGHLQELSEQNIIDCFKENNESEGLNPRTALEFIMFNGIDTEASYPYKGKVGKCKTSSGQLAAWVLDIEEIPPGNSEILKEKVAEKGPVSVCLHIDDKDGTYKNYDGGVYNNENCNQGRADLNHALLLVGYGETYNGQQYWILKNSFGIDWGEKGYMRLARNDTINTCGIATLAIYPISKDPFSP